jgi:hypothetical protein
MVQGPSSSSISRSVSQAVVNTAIKTDSTKIKMERRIGFFIEYARSSKNRKQKSERPLLLKKAKHGSLNFFRDNRE